MLELGLIQRLITLGHNGLLDDVQIGTSYQDLAKYDILNRHGPAAWNVCAATLSTDDLIALIKALTVCERVFRWRGGSVSSVIWIYRILERREPEMAHEVADWILARTSNRYLPFGFHNYDAHSLASYYAAREASHARAAANIEKDRLRQEADKVRKAAQRVVADQQRAQFRERSTHRCQILEALTRFSAVECLQFITTQSRTGDVFPSRVCHGAPGRPVPDRCEDAPTTSCTDKTHAAWTVETAAYADVGHGTI